MRGRQSEAYLVTAGLAKKFVSRVDAKDGANSEVGVNNGAAIQRVEGHGEALSCTMG